MKKICLIGLCLWISVSLMHSQSCFPSGITFESQSDVDLFPSLHPNCTIIEGDFKVDGFDITNLDSLYAIEVIEGDFEIYASSLTNFQGLNNLDTIKGELFVAGSSFSLINVQGLESLKVLGINSNYHEFQGSSITDVSGLDSLQSVNGTLIFSFCYNLASLSGFESEIEMDGLIIEECNALTSLGFDNKMDIIDFKLEALNSLGNLNGFEKISSAATIELRDLSALSNLDSIYVLDTVQSLTMVNCDLLTDLSGLEGWNKIVQTITFQYNSNLENLDALENVNLSEVTQLTISSNAMLSQCSASSICGFLNEAGNSTIQFNDPGCNSEIEITTACCLADPLLCPDDSKSCLPDGITFSSQAEIDNFSTVYTGCKRIGGDVIINGADITHLDSLYSVEVIEGSLTLFHSALVDFQGLNQLDSIHNRFTVHNFTQSLANFEGLEQLKTIGSDTNGAFVITGSSITSFTGLDSLHSIAGDFDVSSCPHITSLLGMESLSTTNNFTISNCINFNAFDLQTNLQVNELVLNHLPVLVHLNGLEKLMNAATIDLSYLSGLVGMDSLYQLTSLQDIRIRHCSLLPNFNGLQGLNSIANELIIESNSELINIEGLQNADLLNVSQLSIATNPKLSDCAIASICDYVDFYGSISVENNAVGCNTEGEIIVACCDNNVNWCPEPQESCLPNGITFGSQLEIDLFPKAYPGCLNIGGNVIIHGSDITHLDSLISLEIINGDLRLNENKLMNLSGLNNLDTIRNELQITSESDSLISLIGLESLKVIGTDFGATHQISFVDITSMEGLDSLQQVNGELEIKNCYQLTSLAGMDQLAIIDELRIQSSASFTAWGLSQNIVASQIELNELSNLSSMNGFQFIDSLFSLRLINLDGLVQLDSLYSIRTMSNLIIDDCDNLTTLNGLEGLESLTNYNLKIEDNNVLDDISALENTNFSSLSGITIRDNPLLSTCNINSLCSYIEMGGNTTISDNLVGCNNVKEIEYDCANLLSIFIDPSNSLTGSSDNFWHTPQNWKNGQVPTALNYVIVPENKSCYIQQDSIAECKLIEIQNNGVVTCGSNASMIVHQE
ncbi:MAG: hypothetical protein P1U56_06750 [Saprospiraceae bacterium]|nr:hypothetical protein [Saprospiraceae bacterium]